MAKRRTVEEDEFVSVDKMFPSKHAKVHGVVTSLSHMKSNAAGTSRYFSGELTDGNSRRRIVGVDTNTHQKLTAFQEAKEPVLLTNCEVKESSYTSDLEAGMQKSPVKFSVNIEELEIASPVIVPLNELPKLANFQTITIKVKVTDVSDVTNVNDLTKQEYTMADKTAASKIVTVYAETRHLSLKLILRYGPKTRPTVNYGENAFFSHRCSITSVEHGYVL